MDAVAAQADVVAVHGENVVMGETLDRALATHEPGVVILELGGNDGLRGLPVSRVESNLGLLITKSRAAGAQVLLLTVNMPTNYGPQYTSSYRKIYDDLRSRYKIGVGALMSPELALDLTYFQPDGIHPNAHGARTAGNTSAPSPTSMGTTTLNAAVKCRRCRRTPAEAMAAPVAR